MICLLPLLIPIWSHIFIVRIVYVVVMCLSIRLHQSNQAHSTTCLGFMLCKYQNFYYIAYCNLQHINVYVQLFVYIYSAILGEG
jgi:hypothetical protein